MKRKKYNTLLLDADGTILDFDKANRFSFLHLMRELEIDDTDESYELFCQINKKHWSDFEQGKIVQEKLVSNIYGDFFTALQQNDIDYNEADHRFLFYLSQAGFLFPNALEFVKNVSKYMTVIVLTNGHDKVQRSRLELAGVIPYLSGVYTSEQIGYAKPQPEFFEYFFNDRLELKKEEMILLGDSLISDIGGAEQVGIDSCLLDFNCDGIQNTSAVSIVSSYNAFCEEFLFPK